MSTSKPRVTGLLQRREVQLGALALALGVAVACAADEPNGELVLANRQRVQSNYVAWRETDRGKGVHLARAASGTRKGKSVGAIRPAIINGSDRWASVNGEGNCGATFISDRYAVTAAHCVGQQNLPDIYDLPPRPTGSPFVIEQYDTTLLDINEASLQSYVVNTWPGWDRNNKLTSAEGYKVTAYTCYVYTRCDSFFGRDARCPVARDVDIAMVYCPSRSKTGSNWSKVATSDSGTGNVEVWWFHEVLYLATSNTNSAYQPTNNWANYGMLGEVPANSNFHYRYDLGRAQLLPLISFLDVANNPYHGVGYDDPPDYVKTNVPACHGTSGSGVFRGTGLTDPDPQFLGPVVFGGTLSDTNLCENISITNDTMREGYAARGNSAKLEALAVVQGDRL